MTTLNCHLAKVKTKYEINMKTTCPKLLRVVCCQLPFFHPWTPGYVISQQSLPVGTGAITAAMFCFLDWSEQEERWGCEAAGLSGGTQHCLWWPGVWLLASLHRPSTISRLTGTHTIWHGMRSQCKSPCSLHASHPRGMCVYGVLCAPGLMGGDGEG